MNFDAILLPPRRESMVADGFWRDLTINDYLDRCVARSPDKTAVTAVSIERGEITRLTYREIVNVDGAGMRAGVSFAF